MGSVVCILGAMTRHGRSSARRARLISARRGRCTQECGFSAAPARCSRMWACASLGEPQRKVQLPEPDRAVLEPDAIEALVVALRRRGFRVLGPSVRDGAIVYDDLESAAALPIGWTDDQAPGALPAGAPRGRGALRLRRRPALLEAVPAPRPPAHLALAPRRRELRRSKPETHERPPLALIGVRGCELAAIAIQDRVLHRRRVRRGGLRRAPRRRLHRRRRLLRARRHVLLHVDGRRPAGCAATATSC